MGAFNRFIIAAVVMTSSLMGATSTNATVVSSGSCQSIFSLTATDMNGTVKAGSFTEIYGVTKLEFWDAWFELNHVNTSSGVANICALTNTQIDALEEDFGDQFDPTFNAGDQVMVTFMPDSSSVMQTYRHTLTGVQAAAANNKTQVVLPNLVVAPTSQISLVVKDSLGAVQQAADWEVWEETVRIVDGETQTDFSFLTYATTSSSGTVEIAGLGNGNFQLAASPGTNPSANSMRTKANFSISAGGSATFASSNVSNGVLTLEDANVKFRLVDGNGSPFDTSVLGQVGTYINDEDLPWDTVTRRQDGTFVAKVPNRTDYELYVSVPSESGFVDTRFQIDVVNGSSSFKKNGTTVSPSNGLVSLQMDLPNIGFRVLGADGNAVPSASVQIFSDENCPTENSLTNIYECDPNLIHANITDLGTGIAKVSNGSYWLRMEPWNGSFGSKTSLSRFTVSSNVVVSASGEARLVPSTDPDAVFGEDTLIVSSLVANLKANVSTQTGSIVIDGGYSNSNPVCPEGQDCDFGENEMSWSEIDSTGRIALNLVKASVGLTKSYEVYVSPSGRLRDEVSSIRLTASVDDEGEVTNLSLPSYLPTTFPEPVLGQDGFWSIKLPVNNFAGSVLHPTSSNVAPNSNINLEKWNSEDSEYEGVDGLGGLEVDENGRFGAFVSPGRYKVEVSPPFDLGRATRKNYEIAVSSAGTICLFADSTESTETPGSYSCSNVVPLGDLDFRLGNPNVSGQIKIGNSTISREVIEQSNASLYIYDNRGSHWNHENNSQIAGDGSYSFNIENVGTYKIDVDPGYLEGYGSTSHYLVVGQNYNDDLTFCNIPEPGLTTLSNVTCGDEDVVVSSISTDISLQPTNLRLNVTVPGTFDGWVYASLSKLYDVAGSERQIYDNSLQLRRGTNSNTFIGFSALGDNNTDVAKYRISISSYQDDEDSLPLADKSTIVWAGNLDGDSEIEICPVAPVLDGSQLECSQPVFDSNNAMNVTLDSGNLFGRVNSPNVEIKVPNPQVEVQRWGRAYWSGSSWVYSWFWTNNYARGNSDGAFALDIDDAGYYKVTAKQQWGGNLPFANKETLIQVNQDGDWCVHEDVIPNYKASDQPIVDSCADSEWGRENINTTNGVDGLTLTLPTPKISGELKYRSGDYAEDSYIQIRKWNGSDTYGYFEYAGWANVNSEGKFYLNPIDGDYQLEFYPSWENKLTDVSFVKNLCLGVGTAQNTHRPQAAGTCAASYSLTERFEGPNLAATVCQAGYTASICEPVDWSWIEVREQGIRALDDPNRDDPNYWQWLNKGTSTNREGKFAIQLDKGTNDDPKLYSLRVYPRNTGEQGVSNRVVVSMGATECKVGETPSSLVIVPCLALKIGLLSPNVNAMLTYDDTWDRPENLRMPMKHSWVSIFGNNYSSYITGESTNWQGKFSTYLTPGTAESPAIYFVDAYSNANYASRPSLRLTLKVSSITANGQTTTQTSWKYRNEPNSDYKTTPIVADFDKIAPNVLIQLSPSFLASHIVLVKDLGMDSASQSDASFIEQPRRFVSKQLQADGPQTATGVLTVGKTYSFKVIPNYKEVLNGGASCTVTVPITKVEDSGEYDLVNLSACAPQTVAP